MNRIVRAPLTLAIFFAALLVSLLATPRAEAWGVLRDLTRQSWGPLYLTRFVLEGRPIRYCIWNSYGTGLSDSSADAQFRLAMSLYFDVLTNHGALMQAPPLEQVSCRSSELNVKVALGSFPGRVSGGEVGPDSETNPRVLLMNINAWVDEAPLVDGRRLFGDIDRLRATLGPWPMDSRMALPMNFVGRVGVDETAYRRSSWPKFLHEAGHLFGLADTYWDDATFAERTEPSLRGRAGAGSVMLGRDYPMFTDDDVAGLVALREGVRRMLAGLPIGVGPESRPAPRPRAARR